jgi:predicted transcriptional regulator
MVEGYVNELLNSRNVKVTFEVSDVANTQKILGTSQWTNKIQSYNNVSILFSLDLVEIPLLNKFLVENGVQVNAIIPARSLEDYFLKITSGSM